MQTNSTNKVFKLNRAQKKVPLLLLDVKMIAERFAGIFRPSKPRNKARRMLLVFKNSKSTVNKIIMVKNKEEK